MLTRHCISIDKVLKDKNLRSYLHFYANKLKSNVYYTVGDYLKELPQKDFDKLLEDKLQFESNAITNNNTTLSLTMLISLMALGEGYHDIDKEKYGEKINRLFLLLLLEKSFRLGYNQVKHENFSLFDMKELTKGELNDTK